MLLLSRLQWMLLSCRFVRRHQTSLRMTSTCDTWLSRWLVGHVVLVSKGSVSLPPASTVSFGGVFSTRRPTSVHRLFHCCICMCLGHNKLWCLAPSSHISARTFSAHNSVWAQAFYKQTCKCCVALLLCHLRMHWAQCNWEYSLKTPLLLLSFC